MRHLSAIGLMTAATLGLAGCTGTSGPALPTATGTPTASASASTKVYTEDELRELISGMKDKEGNELRLYSKEQVDQGGNIAGLLLGTATVTPQACRDIATAGLLDSVESGALAVALSQDDQPRTLSAQSGSEGPDAVQLLGTISDTMDQCTTFSVEALGQRYEVTSEELEAKTDADKTFASLSTRRDDPQQKLMQVSGAEGRLLVVATKSGPNLGDADQEELKDLINAVLHKADGSGTPSPASSGSASPRATASSTPSVTPTASSVGTPSASPTPTR